MVYKNIRNILILITVSIWIAVFGVNNKLHIIACDVGQGDAILIQKQNTQILIDGGPNQKVLDCLGKYMPFWDRTIELVILTHPQEDHYGGLIDVFKFYKVDMFGEYNRETSNMSYQVLRNEVGSNGVKTITLNDGLKLRLDMIYLDILTHSEDQGVVTLLSYFKYKALFMADVEQEVSNKISELSQIQNINYIKVNHHGSKNGLSQKLLDVTDPEVAVISVGKNSYGHPHKEVIKILSDKDIKILRTDLLGDIDTKIP